MKVSNTAERLREFLRINDLRQVDFLKRLEPYCQTHGIKFGKSHLSLYLSGKVEPKQDKLAIIGLVFNVNEAWLMGYDVPMYRPPVTLDPGFPRKKIPPRVSDKAIKVVLKMDTRLYSDVCALAEEDSRSFEEELEYLLFSAVENEVEERYFKWE